jgi:hypothetical protein
MIFKNGQRCPYCPADSGEAFDPFKLAHCVLNKPLFMVIPPEGVHLNCPVHPEGHHVHGPRVTWMSKQTSTDASQQIIDYDSSGRFVDFDSRRRTTSTGIWE